MRGENRNCEMWQKELKLQSGAASGCILLNCKYFSIRMHQQRMQCKQFSPSGHNKKGNPRRTQKTKNTHTQKGHTKCWLGKKNSQKSAPYGNPGRCVAAATMAQFISSLIGFFVLNCTWLAEGGLVGVFSTIQLGLVGAVLWVMAGSCPNWLKGRAHHVL